MYVYCIIVYSLFKSFSSICTLYIYCSTINILVYKSFPLILGIIKDYDFVSYTLHTLTHPYFHPCGPSWVTWYSGVWLSTNDVSPPSAINVHLVGFPLISHLINYVDIVVVNFHQHLYYTWLYTFKLYMCIRCTTGSEILTFRTMFFVLSKYCFPSRKMVKLHTSLPFRGQNAQIV